MIPLKDMTTVDSTLRCAGNYTYRPGNTIPVLSFLGVELTPRLHLWFNEILERCHRTLKATIMTQDDSARSQVLPLVPLGLRTVNSKEFTGSSAELVYGENLGFSSDLLFEIRRSLNTVLLLS